MDKNKLAVMVAMHCDPFQAIYYKELFKKYWGNEVGGLYMKLSGVNYLGSKQFILDLFKDTAKFIDYDVSINDHGKTLNALYPEIPNDYEVVMIMDSDEWIYKQGLVTDFLNSFDDGIDIVGDWCDSGSVRLKDMAHAKFGRCRLNPMITLIRKSLLDKIDDINFSAKNWESGEKVKELDWVVPDEFPPSYGDCKLECTDTFGYVGLQLLQHTNNLRLISIMQSGLFHAASLSSWMITYSQQEPIYHDGQQFLDRLSWWYWLAKRYGDQYIRTATKKHIDKLVAFARINNITQVDMVKHQEDLFKRIPELNI